MLNRDDFAFLFTEDVELMEARYAEPFIYKYYHFPDAVVQREFFARPTIKFAHKDDLNDPFELSRRWAKFGCPLTKEVFDKYVFKRIERQFSDISSMRKEIQARAKQRDPSLSRQQRRRIVSSRIGRSELAREIRDQRERIAIIAREMPRIFQEHESEFIEAFIRETGILSLTERPKDLKLWERYASNGCGFVLEFHAEHEFFRHKAEDGKTRKLLRKVFYRDDPIVDFWQNPNYLFLVKETDEWSVENEWRMLKGLDQCRKVTLATGQSLYLVDAPLKMIRSVIFGYNFPTKLIEEYAASLLRFDSDIRVQRAHLDPEGKLVTCL